MDAPTSNLLNAGLYTVPDAARLTDPRRNFGQPTVMKSGVPAATLARSVKANSSQEVVARWYEVHPDEVRDAVEFEQSLAKAA